LPVVAGAARIGGTGGTGDMGGMGGMGDTPSKDALLTEDCSASRGQYKVGTAHF